MRLFENNNPIDMNIPHKLGKFLFNITKEALAGRLEKKDGSFDWKNEKGWELPIKEWEPLVPTHGNFAGPGYSCGQRGEFSPEQILKHPIAEVYDPKIGRKRNDYVDTLAKDHDLAYAKARKEPDYWQRIGEADTILVNETRRLLDGTSPLFSNGGQMTPGERAYAGSMLDGFKIKQVMINELPADLERLRDSGYGMKRVNDYLNNLSQGLQFPNIREILGRLNLSENEIGEVEQMVASCSGRDFIGTGILKADAASDPGSDEREDEDQGYYYGPGMGMG